MKIEKCPDTCDMDAQNIVNDTDTMTDTEVIKINAILHDNIVTSQLWKMQAIKQSLLTYLSENSW